MKKLNIIAMCVIASILVACGGGSGSGNGEKYDLHYKLEPGKVYSQNMEMDMKMTATVMGQSMDMGIAMGFGMDFTVADTTDGIISGKYKLTFIEMGMTTPMGNFSFSSEDESGSSNAMMPFDVSKLFRAMKDFNLDMSMTKYGEVKSMGGIEEMMDQMFGSMGLSSSEVAQAKAIMEQSFSEEKMMEQVKNMEIYPNHPVAIGDSWKMDVSTSQMDMENTYTLKKVTDNEVIIEVKSKINDMYVEGFSGSIEGTQAGTTTVHRSSGWIKEGKIQQDIKGSGTMQGMNSKITIKSDIAIGE